MFPTVNVLFLLMYKARTSVPSITQPPLIARPIPPPRNKPPKKAINKRSWVIDSKGITTNKKASAIMATDVLIAKTLPICL
ncbi:hypothetical protein D3C87_1792290 [compost metagenome]